MLPFFSALGITIQTFGITRGYGGMAHPKYGEKFSCFQCDIKFYDMSKPEPVCPKCGANQRKAPKKPSVKASKAPVIVEDFDTEEDDTLPEDLDTFPVKDEEEEPKFDPERDHLSLDAVPDQDY